MATTPLHSTNFPAKFPSSVRRLVLVPQLPACFLQARLHELHTINRQLAQLGYRLRRDIDTCENDAASTDLFTAAALVRLWQDVRQLEAQTSEVLQTSSRRLEQATLACQQLHREVNHG